MFLKIQISYAISQEKYNKNTNNIKDKGNNIDLCIDVSPKTLTLAGWWSVGQKITEYLIIKRLMIPRTDIAAQIFEDKF